VCGKQVEISRLLKRISASYYQWQKYCSLSHVSKPFYLKTGGYRAWDLGEEKDKEVQEFPLNRGDEPRRCEQHF